MSAHESITGTSRPDFCKPTRDRRPTVMQRIAISAAPDTGDIPATMARGARKPMTIATITAYRRPPDIAAAIPTMAGIDAQVAAPCTSPVPTHVMSTMTMAGSSTSTTAAMTRVRRRLTGIFTGVLAIDTPMSLLVPGS